MPVLKCQSANSKAAIPSSESFLCFERLHYEINPNILSHYARCQRWNGKIIRVNYKTALHYGEQVLDIRKLNYDVADELSGRSLLGKASEYFWKTFRDFFFYFLFFKSSQFLNGGLGNDLIEFENR